MAGRPLLAEPNQNKRKMTGNSSAASDILQKNLGDITTMIKAQQLPEWQNEVPSYEYLPKTANGGESANRIFAKYVAMNTNTILERTMSGLVTAIRMLEESKLRDNNLSAQIGLLKNGQKEQIQIIQELRQEIAEMRSEEKNKGQKNEVGQTTSAGRTANDGRRAQNKRPPKPGNGSYPVGSSELSAEINKKQKFEAEKKFRLKMDQDGKNVHREEFTPAPTRKRNKPQKSAPQLAAEDRKRLRNEEQTAREIIFHGIPTPVSYSEGTKSEEAKKILAVLEELRTKYLGKTDGINVSPSDFAFATRQQGHIKKDFKPLTA